MPDTTKNSVKFQIGEAPPDTETLSKLAAASPRTKARSGTRWLILIMILLTIAAGAYGYIDLKQRLTQNQYAGSEIEKNMKAFSAQQQQRIDEANTQLATLEKRQTELVETLQKTAAQLEEAQKSLEKKADQTTLAKEATSRKQMEENLADLKGVNERLGALNDRIDKISANLDGEMKELSLLLNDTAKGVIDLKSEMAEVVKRSGPGDLKEALQEQVSTVEKQVKETNTSLERLSGKVNGLASTATEVKQQVARYDSEFIKMKKNLSLYDDTILRLTSQLRNMESRLEALSPGIGQEILREQHLNQ